MKNVRKWNERCAWKERMRGVKKNRREWRKGNGSGAKGIEKKEEGEKGTKKKRIICIFQGTELLLVSKILKMNESRIQITNKYENHESK